ncbi:MAG: fibronectin type III domain-containing protein, partial [Bacteroidia bacterium]|nr:fibronectin type III domain-containing protein [Bacteroidia bacterium]MDW8159624.1 fibronectin type III domain-containing protein [Bacteroidia bacterium]
PITNATYIWRGPNNFSVTTTEPQGAFPSIGLNATGTYTLTVSLNGCISTQTSNVIINPRIAPASTSNSPVCVGNSLRLVAPTLAGAAYNWSGPASFSSTLQNPIITQISTSQAGVYTVIINYPNCPTVTQTVNVEVNEPPLPIQITSNPARVCQNGSLELFANSQPKGAIFNWTGPNRFSASTQNVVRQNIAFADGGNYTLTVRTPGCPERSESISITVNPTPNSPIATLSSPICVGQTLSLTILNPQNNLQYLWRGPNNFSSTLPNTQINELTEAAEGVYSATAILNGCTSLPLVLLAEVNPIAIATATITPTSRPGRNDGSINVTLSQSVAPVRYAWGGPSNFSATTASISGLRAGTYTLTLTNGNGCVSTYTYTVGTQPPITVSILAQRPTCFGASNGSLMAQVTGGLPPYQYEWSGPNGFSATTPLIQNLRAGTYQLLVSDFVGNLELVDFTLTEPNPLRLVGDIQPISCFGANDARVLLSATGGTSPYVFTWQDGIESPIRNTVAKGTYVVTTRDINGCTRRDTLNIVEPPLLTTTFTITQLLACLPDSKAKICINISGGTAPYQFYYAESQETTLVSTPGNCVLEQNQGIGTYQYFVRDSRGCIARQSFSITSPPLPTVQLVFLRNAGCLNDGSILVRAVGGREPYQYVWENGATTNALNNLAPGDYRLLVIDAAACQAETTFTVGLREDLPRPILNVNTVGVSCPTTNDGQILATAILEGKPTAVIEYSLDGQVYQRNGTFTQLAAGNYTVYAREVGSRCVATIDVSVSNYFPASALVISQVTTSQAFVSWIAASSSQTRYRVEYRVQGAQAWSSTGLILGTDTLLQNLQNNTLYQVRVISICGRGTEIASDVVTFRTRISPASCRVPGSVYVNTINPTTALLNWEAIPGFTGCYVIEYRPLGSPNWQVELATSAFSRYELRGLQPASEYQVRVRANCTACSPSVGTFSEYSPIVTYRAPTLRLLSEESEEVKPQLTWKATLYPNPTNGIFEIEISLEHALEVMQNEAILQIFDLQGRLLHSEPLQLQLEGNILKTVGSQYFSLPESQGLYLVGISLGNQKQMIKVIKQ